ncbi:uncharacterized protein TRIADDRAFT_53554 [Trichoplax adhaerens]|uniref:Protein kinase domain-containing protein n=1 Tax=Trichoplax adhaerens TaxID=10228 RepID=B3RPI4_TRIAD|nr:hypothetical protein TRIADDRAFT_53554 [Trichoplax adhaerens]EDV28193.1 hypothetical protein TRIADDRAFT_53554 [Trichoplax adhaerens]|eukprot:XP_002110027.1 hypothetical protein TRIADDRAFT_53554 [Trichoplax adhaerens]
MTDAKRYKFLERIDGKDNSNNSTTVWTAEDSKSGNMIAIKRINLENKCIKDLEILRNEIAAVRSFKHPNIICYYDAATVGNETWLSMPYYSYGSSVNLFAMDILPNQKELLLMHVLRSVLNALIYLHELGYAHRDIKGKNILISANGNVCLSGMDKATKKSTFKQDWVAHEFIERAADSVVWAAPELLAQDIHGYNCKVDIYSLGMTAVELAYGRIPFDDMPVTQILLEKLNGISHARIHSFIQNTTDVVFSNSFYQLLDSCFKSDSDRWSAVQLATHPFFKRIKITNEDILQEFLHLAKPISEFKVSEGDY